ncbi:MAG: hypothetical protein ACTSQ8_13680 [Candidatus Helarchaeota archaeon]
MEKFIRTSIELEEEVKIVDNVATTINLKKNNLFRSKEFLNELFNEATIKNMWAYPFLTDHILGLILFAENENNNLQFNQWKMDLTFIEDIKFKASKRTIIVKYNIPKASKGFLGRGGHKGTIEFSTLNFPTWQSELSLIILGSEKERLENELNNLLPEYEETKEKLEELQQNYLSGAITEEQHDKFAKDLRKRFKNFEKRKKEIEKDLKSIKV